MGRLYNADGSQVAASANGGGGRLNLEELNRSFNEDQKKKKQAPKAAPKKKKKETNPLLDVIGAIGGAAKAVGEGVAAGYKRTGEGVAEVINEATGGAQKARDVQAKSDAEDVKTIKTLGEKMRASKDNKERERYRTAISKISKISSQQSNDFSKRQSEIAERVDPAKGAGAIASIGLDVVTGGAGGAALRAGSTALKTGRLAKGVIPTVSELAKQTSKLTGKEALKKVGVESAKGAGIGAGYGAAGTLQNKGSESTFEEFQNNIAAGAALGGAIPVLGRGAKVVKNAKPLQKVDSLIADAARKATTAVGKTKAGKFVGDVTEKVQVAMGESLAPVMRDFKGLVDKDGRKVTENVRLLDSNVVNSSSIAQARLKENPAWNDLANLFEPATTKPGSLRAARKEKEELGKFISAKQEAINTNKLKPKSQVEVPVGTPKQEKAYELLNKATKDDVQYAFDNDLITKSNYKKYMADDNYTRVQRDMGDDLASRSNFKGVGGANGSISSNSFQQRLTGSKKDALDPFAAHYDWTNKVTREAQRQKLSNYIVTKRQENGLGKGFLREADRVETRQQAVGEANQLRVLRKGLDKAVKSETKYGKRLEQELNSLSKRGKDLSIKNAGSSKLPRPRSGPKAHIDSLVKTSTADLTRIRNKVAKREPKLAAHIDNLVSLKNSHEVARKAVKELTDLARANGDQRLTNKSTIKTFTRGIKEVYEDEPRIVDAINKVGRVDLHALVRFAQAPSKAVQRTATSLNFVFSAANPVRDQVSSFVNSKNAMATHNPISFMLGIKEAVAKPAAKAALRTVGLRKAADKVLNPTKEYEQFLKYIKGSTRTDITREMKKTARAANESLGLKNEKFIGKLENINSATENSTRFQNYIGTLRSEVKKGTPYETAVKNAVQAGRENSVDFSRSGDFAPFMKIFNPFINANIQGSRSLVRAFAERPLATSMKVGSAVLMPVAASTYYNLSDPKRSLIYSQLSDADRDNNLVFIHEDGTVTKIPLAPGIKEFGVPVRNLIEAEYGRGDPQSFAATAKSIFADSVNPLNLGDLIPTAAKPVVEGITNHSFFTGKEIVPEYLKDKDPNEQVFKGTSQSYRDIAKQFGISPLIAKNVISGYTTSVGEQGVSLFDQLRKAGGQDVVTDKRNTLQQLAGKFYEDKPDQNAAANRVFFDAYDPVKARKDRTSKEVTSLVKDGKLQQAKRIASEFNESVAGSFTKFKSDYSSNSDIEQDPMWSDMLDDLQIKTSDRAFKARLKQ